MNELLLHYDFLPVFNQFYYKDLLTQEHLHKGQQNLKKLYYPDGEADERANFWGYVFEKDDTKYLLSSTDPETGREINLSKKLPIKALDLQKVSDGKNVYWNIRRPVSMKFKSVLAIPPQELLKQLTAFSNTNLIHQKLMVFIGLTSLIQRGNFRVCTPPGFGKDSVVTTLGALMGNAGTIENPTVAKLEERASVLKWLAVNEVCDITPAAWRDIEQILLSMGDHKPYVTKRSRAVRGVKEVIDISNFSITLMYNDIDTYPKIDKFFDRVSKKSILHRYPALRLWGGYTFDFNKSNRYKAETFVKNNFETYKNIIYTITYLKNNFDKMIHHYDTSKLMHTNQRWSVNLERLLRTVDVFSETQEEFDMYLEAINNAIVDYREMLKFPELMEGVVAKIEERFPDKKIAKLKALTSLLRRENTFIDKNKILKHYAFEDVQKEQHEWW